jgi:hypothetical protein
MDLIKELHNPQKWEKGKRWITETKKCLSKGSYFDPETIGWNYNTMVQIAADFDLLSSFMLDCKEDNFRETANRIREKYYSYLCNMLMTKNLLKDGLMDYSLLRKQYMLIYETKQEGETKKSNKFKSNKKLFTPYKEN